VKLSVIIPVYNEAATIAQVVEQVSDVALDGIEKEIVIVNDGSTDETATVLDALIARWPNPLKVVHHEQNRGKGAAIRTALDHATGNLVITQDADLEYDPQDYPALLAPFNDPAVQVVYGSRNLRANPRSTWSFYWGGRLLSWIANLLYGSRITDEATGYKVFRTNLLRDLNLESTRFEFCPEATAKILRRGVEIHEVPISYRPRSFAQGKKIDWHDGLEAIWVLLKYRFRHASKEG
jgi:dolichol-phosphate mannosyltransferase